MTAVLDELSGLKEQRVAEFHAAIDRMLAGEEIAADELEMICLRAGKATHEFASIVRTRQQRVNDRARLEELPAVRQQLADLDAQIAANDDAIEAARRAHLQQAYNLNGLRDALRTQLGDLNGLKERLIKDCRVSELRERCGTIDLYLEQLRRNRNDAERQLGTQQAHLRDVSRRQVERWWLDRDARSPSLPANVDDNDPWALEKRRVIRAQQAIDKIDEQRDAYLNEQREIREQQFQW